MTDGVHEFARLAQRVFNVPVMMRPEKMEVVAAALADRLNILQIDKIDGTTMGVIEMRQRAASEPSAATSKIYDFDDGIATIQVEGSLVSKLSGLQPRSGMTGYNQIEAKLEQARADPDVAGILMEHDSPGGEASRVFELAKKIYNGSARFGGKPVFTFVNEMSCSASYALAAPTDEIHMPEGGVVGSIGVWVLLVEFTAALKKGGIKAAMRRAGERKARGGPYEKWDQATLDKIDTWLEDTRAMFANLVAQARKLDVGDVLATEGDWFYDQEAMDLGLVDGIGSREAVIGRLRQRAGL
jgi:capsid assembly protease